jgi:CDP-glucose 4,6-dehydratase
MDNAEFWNQRKVLITGASGLVGAHLAQRLVEAGAQVVCLQRGLAPNDPLHRFGLRDRITRLSASVEDFMRVESILHEHQIDTVFHLAAQAIAAIANAAPRTTFETNIRGTYTVLDACRVSPSVRRIVVASSDRVYGDGPRERPITEDDPLNGSSPYDASKVCADLLAQSFARNFQVPVAIARTGNLYGPGDLHPSRIIPGTILSLLQNQPPVLTSDGTPIREFLFVEDAVSAYLEMAMRIEITAGEAFNFSSGEPIRMLTLVERILQIAGSSLPPCILGAPSTTNRNNTRLLSIEKAVERLRWRPQVSLAEGLKQTIDWHRELSRTPPSKTDIS